MKPTIEELKRALDEALVAVSVARDSLSLARDAYYAALVELAPIKVGDTVLAKNGYRRPILEYQITLIKPYGMGDYGYRGITRKKDGQWGVRVHYLQNVEAIS